MPGLTIRDCALNLAQYWHTALAALSGKERRVTGPLILKNGRIGHEYYGGGNGAV